MVYESDFYTTRRPYSRPTITTYSVTGGHVIPHVAHKRLNLSTPPPAFRLRNAVLLGELDRIYTRPRPHVASVPTEDFLNSRPLVSFDDETKSIRAQTQALLRKVHAPIPRSSRPLILSGVIPYHELPIPERITSDPYIRRMLEPVILQDVVNISHYNEPSKVSIGRGHLACMTFAGGRGYPRRKHLFSDENRDIRDEIKFRSYYDRNRMAAKEREAANTLPTGFASRLLRLTSPEPEPQRRTIKPYRHTMSTPSELQKKGEEAKAKELNDLEVRIQKRRKEKDQTSTTDKGDDVNKKKQEEKNILAEESRQREEEKQNEEAKLKEKIKRAEEEKKLEAYRKEEEKRKAEEELRKAEEIRIAEEKRKAEELRKVEETRIAEEKRKAEEELRKAEEARIAEEKRKAEEELKKAEEARIAEEKRKAEELRKAEEAKKAEEEAQKKMEEDIQKAEELRLLEESKTAENEEDALKKEIQLNENKTEDERLFEQNTISEVKDIEKKVEVTTVTKNKEENNIIEEEINIEVEIRSQKETFKMSDEVGEEETTMNELKEMVKETDIITNATLEGEEILTEPIIEEPQSPDAEDAVAEVIEGADATSEELEDQD